MPSITLTTDATETTKLQAVVDFYNSRAGTNYTAKQWIIAMLRERFRYYNQERITALNATSEEVVIT